MNYAAIKLCDISNGPGVRTSLFVSGCTHHCPGCFNEIAWDFHYGKPFTGDVQQSLIDSCRPAYMAGISLLGGEPMEPENQYALLPFLEKLRAECPGKTIWVYSGYTLEQLLGMEKSRCRCDVTDRFLSLCDVLVDGRFLQEQYDISLRFRGSANQRVLDLPASIRNAAPVLWQDDPIFSTHTME